MLAMAIVLVLVSSVNAEYLLIHYTMAFKKPQADAKGGGAPKNQPPGVPQPANPDESDVIQVPVTAAVEINNFQVMQNPVSGRVKAWCKTPYGKTSLYNDDALVTRRVPVPTVRARYNAQKAALAAKRTDEKVFDLAEWCLNHALLDEFAALMEEVAKSGKATGLDKLDRAVEAFTKVKAALAQRIDREDASNYWRGRLGFRMSQSDHYTLLYNAALQDPPEVQQRLKALENNMRAVYYWFALRGVALPMPDQKLVCVLLDQPDQFQLQRQLIEDEPLVTDGFFSARDNVVVFSTQRLDFESQMFGRQMQNLYQQGWEKEKLLKGDASATLAGKSTDEKYRMQTLALLDRALDEEAERAAVSHEGTRQILVGCGLQKPTVVMPDWMQFGMASVFETSKGPFRLVPPELSVAYWPGYGAPSWAYTRIFKLLERGHLPGTEPSQLQLFRVRGETTSASQLLREVVTDSEFSRARDLGPRAGQTRLLEARARAWALCYYLTKMRTQGILQFYGELAKMPRDMELEPNQILAAFCRAFDCANTTGTGPDPGRFEELAKDWLGFMASVRPPGAEFNLDVPQGNPAGGGSGPQGGGNPKGGAPKKGGGG
jgi:hypothetical protein